MRHEKRRMRVQTMNVVKPDGIIIKVVSSPISAIVFLVITVIFFAGLFLIGEIKRKP